MRSAILAVFCVHCAAATSAGPDGYRSKTAPNLRIVKKHEIENLPLATRDVTHTFGPGENGTQLVDEMLKELQAQGAQFITEPEFAMALQAEGQWLLCHTYVTPEGESHTQLVARPVPRPGQFRHVQRPVTRVVTEYEYRCRMVSKPVQRLETTYEYRYDYLSKRSQSQPVSRYVTRYEYQNECRNEPVTKTVTRYEYQLEQQYVPPEWKMFLESYTAYVLVETEPTCDEAAPPLSLSKPHQLRARAFFPLD